jgi:penicillin-binding protein 1C
VFTEATTSLIANILSDPAARTREFLGNTAFATPMQTALKTGTSTDYRDAWCLGFTSRHTVGVWLGNLDRTAMHEVTGSKGPAWVVRGIFKELGAAPPLSLSNKLVTREICSVSGALPGQGCPRLTELFLPGTEPKRACHDHAHPAPAPTSDLIALELPTPGLRLARDPRIPDHLEALPLTLPAGVMPHRTEWLVDDTVIGATEGGERRFLWKLLPGIHTARARFWLAEAGTPIETAPVRFTVQ